MKKEGCYIFHTRTQCETSYDGGMSINYDYYDNGYVTQCGITESEAEALENSLESTTIQGYTTIKVLVSYKKQ